MQYLKIIKFNYYKGSNSFGSCQSVATLAQIYICGFWQCEQREIFWAWYHSHMTEKKLHQKAKTEVEYEEEEQEV